jgi:hypothetical protein
LQVSARDAVNLNLDDKVGSAASLPLGKLRNQTIDSPDQRGELHATRPGNGVFALSKSNFHGKFN